MFPLIGIDIGTSSVKVVELEKKNRLSNLFFFPTPYLKERYGKIDKEIFLKQITSKISPSTLKKSLVGVNIPSFLVSVMTIELPKMSRKELEVSVKVEAKRKMVPPPGPKSIFQYTPLRTFSKGKTSFCEVAIVKGESEFVENILDIFDTLGVYPSIISPSCYTLIYSFPHSSDVHQKNTIFVDIGYEYTKFTILEKGSLYIYRSVKFGLKDITSKISSSLNVEFHNAEELIMKEGVPEVDVDLNDRVKVAEEIMRQKYEASLAGKSQEEVNLLELRVLWQTEIEKITQEIRRTLVYYSEQRRERIEDIFFLGGGAGIKGLASCLSQNLGGRCEIFAPLKDMEMLDKFQLSYIERISPLFTNAASIALSIPTLRRKKEVVNFLPREIKEREIIVKKELTAITSVLISFCVVFLLWLNIAINNKVLRKNLANLKMEKKRIAAPVKTLEELKKRKKVIDERALKVKELMGERLDIYSILEKISLITPQKIFLTQLSIFPKKEIGTQIRRRGRSSKKRKEKELKRYILKIRGGCFSTYQEAIDLAGLFKEKLEKESVFTNVKFTPPKLEKVALKREGSEKIILTEPKLRFFSLEAEIVNQ